LKIENFALELVFELELELALELELIPDFITYSIL